MHGQSNHLGSTVLRTGLGLVFLAHGLAKIFVFTMPGTVAFFDSAGFPGFMAWPVMLIELLGGSMLVAGLWTRWASLAMVPVALGATVVHWANGWMFSNPGGGWEYTALLALVAMALFLYGDDGRYSAGELKAKRAEAISS